jgi:hypothetical protein
MGALTSKPFSFAARSWELLDRLAFDCTDTFFSTLKVSFRGKTVIRVLPDFSTNLLSEWISDRVRFSYDSLQNQPEFDSIYQFRISKLSQSFLHFFFKRFYMGSYFFDFVSAQQIRAITDFSGFSGRFYSDLSHLNFDSRTSYSFAYSQILQKSSFKNYFLLGINLRYQLPVFTVALRKLSTLNETFFFNFGYFTNNLVGDINFGSSIKIFQNVIRGKSKISRIYYSASSVVFTNPFIYPLIPTNTTPYVYSFFDNPKNLISAEVFSKFYSVFPLFIYHIFLLLVKFFLVIISFKDLILLFWVKKTLIIFIFFQKNWQLSPLLLIIVLVLLLIHPFICMITTIHILIFRILQAHPSTFFFL